MAINWDYRYTAKYNIISKPNNFLGTYLGFFSLAPLKGFKSCTFTSVILLAPLPHLALVPHPLLPLCPFSCLITPMPQSRSELCRKGMYMLPTNTISLSNSATTISQSVYITMMSSSLKHDDDVEQITGIFSIFGIQKIYILHRLVKYIVLSM